MPVAVHAGAGTYLMRAVPLLAALGRLSGGGGEAPLAQPGAVRRRQGGWDLLACRHPNGGLSRGSMERRESR